jgi:hypothetical protein
MKKIFAILAAMAALAMVGGSGAANADESLGHSCGGSGVALVPQWGMYEGGNIVVLMRWKQNCGDGKTIEVELQHDTLDAPNTWTDVNNLDLQFSTPTNLANQLVTRQHSTSIDCTGIRHQWHYRIHVWWSDGNDTSFTSQFPSDC